MELLFLRFLFGYIKELNKSMIKDFEKAPSARSSCISCKKAIEKGEVRAVEDYMFGRYLAKRYYCLDCSKKLIKDFLEEAGKYIDFK